MLMHYDVMCIIVHQCEEAYKSHSYFEIFNLLNTAVNCMPTLIFAVMNLYTYVRTYSKSRKIT